MRLINVDIHPVYPGSASATYKIKTIAKIEEVAKVQIGKASGFAVSAKDDKDATFVLRLKVTQMKLEAMLTTVIMSSEILKPSGEMVSTTQGTAKASIDGKPSDSSVMDCVEAASENLMGKAIPAMARAAAG
jgi:hypothetical protein